MNGTLTERRRAPLPAALRGKAMLQRILLLPAWVLALGVGVLFLPLVVAFTLHLADAAQAENRGQVQLRLRQLALAAASTIDGDLHETIRDPSQVDSEAYRNMVDSLARLQNAVAGVRDLYTVREENGRLVFVLDAAHSSALRRERDRPAEPMSPFQFDLAQEPRLLETLRAGEAHVDVRPYVNSTGHVLRSVEAPIRNHRGEVVAFLSLDFDESVLAATPSGGRGILWPVLLAASLLTMLVISGLVYWLRRRIGDALQALDRAVKTDALTGLYNRRYFNRRLAREVERAAATGQALSLLIFDADHFKRINDTWGHPSGDAVLQRIGVTLTGLVRYPRWAFRIGGEEFAVLLRGEGAKAALSLFRDLSAAIRSPITIEHAEQPLVVTVSGGVSELGRGEGAESLLTRADQALYVAKNSGRDFAVVAAAV